MKTLKFVKRYLPTMLSPDDKKKQAKMLLKSRRLYKKGKYFTRSKLQSYKHKKSQHILNAERIYKVKNVKPSKELVVSTGCSMNALNAIVKKGEGAYFSSGSRPNQTAQSWGIARLASSITGGKAAAVDFSILENGCDHNKKAYRLALQSRKKYGHGHSGSKKVTFKVFG
jgi:Family of unknown function (DUF5824)